jgi:hypothetical protein
MVLEVTFPYRVVTGLHMPEVVCPFSAARVRRQLLVE